VGSQHAHTSDDRAGQIRAAEAAAIKALKLGTAPMLRLGLRNAHMKLYSKNALTYRESLSLCHFARGKPCFDGLPGSFTPFHWHGETFDLPDEAKLLFQRMVGERMGNKVCLSPEPCDAVSGSNFLGLRCLPEHRF
jgi:hypothetical protein